MATPQNAWQHEIMALTDEQKFLFDLEGYIVLPGVLSSAECDRLSTLADAAWPRREDDSPFRRAEAISLWDQAFVDLMDHQNPFAVS